MQTRNLLMKWVGGRCPGATREELRLRLGQIEGIAAGLISIFLFAIKLALGLWSGSLALMADALNNLADVGAGAIIYAGFRYAQKPRDAEHPFGHGRMEFVTGLVLSMVLILVAFEIARSGVERLLNPEPIAYSRLILWILGFTFVIKIGMALFAHAVARATRSQAMYAEAWNHSVDVLSTLSVFAALMLAHIGWMRVDAWAALGIAALIAWTGLKYAQESVSLLLGLAPTGEEVGAIDSAALSVSGVRGMHDLIVHSYGETRLVSFHIEVDSSLSSLDVHDMAEAVEAAVEKAFPCKCIVHVDPVDRHHPDYQEAERAISDYVAKSGEFSGFHDLRVRGPHGHSEVSVDLVAENSVNRLQQQQLARQAELALQPMFNRVRTVFIVVENSYTKKF